MKELYQNSILVALGGALGALFRHLINLWTFAPAIPAGTVLENISGALLLGMTVGYLAKRKEAPSWLRVGVGTGFCGGYTTTSTFAADTFLVTIHQAPLWAGVYVATSLIFGLLFAVVGISVGERLANSRPEAS